MPLKYVIKFETCIVFIALTFTFNLIVCKRLVMPRSHIHGSPRRFHFGSNPTDDPGNDNFRSPIRVHNASTTTYDYGCNTEIYGLIRIATDDAGSYPWPNPASNP